MDIVTIGVLAYLLGAIFSVVGPYVMTWLEDPTTTFEWRYAVSKGLGALTVGLVAIVAPGFLDVLQNTASLYGEHTFLFVIAMAVLASGAAQLGRFADKFAPLIKKLTQ